jgi:signal transduction histidine kinase
MANIRAGLDGRDGEAVVYPIERFVTDCGQLVADVDRLMLDITSVTRNGVNHRKANGEHHKPTLTHSISTLRNHARSFAKSVRQFGTIHERLPIPYMELDGRARILRTNRESNIVLAPDGKPVLGKSLFAFISASDVQRLREHLAVCRRTDKPCHISVSIAHNASPFRVELLIRRQSATEDTGFSVVALERSHGNVVTLDGGRTEREMQLHELLLKLSRAHTFMSVVQIIGNYCSRALDSPAGMIFIERKGQLQLASQWRSQQVSKKYFSEEAIRRGPATHAFRTGTPIFWSQKRSQLSVSRHLRQPAPGPRSRSAAFLPIIGPNDRPTGVIALVLHNDGDLLPETREDMRHLGEMVSGSIIRARAHDEALAARAAAESANRRHQDHLSMISHELKNPMTPILNWAVALSSRSLPEDKESLAIESIIRNVRALNYLIDDLFDVARISSGKLRLEVAEMRIQDVVREALMATQQSAEKKKLRITTDIPEAIPPFVADPRRVRQVLINLLNNAVKFTPGGGSIALRVARRGDQVECSVADTGQGIDPEFLPFVFDRFKQENRSGSKTKALGLGLGLAIVREIVELHGGTIKAHSRGAHQGATFVFRLPMRKSKTH